MSGSQMPDLAAAASMAGLDYLRAVMRGELRPTPIGQLMGFSLKEVDSGRVVVTVVPRIEHYNVIGTVHGGLAATVIDTAVGCAVLSQLPFDQTFTTLQLNIHYVRGISIDSGELRCEGRIVHAGRQVCTAEGELIDAKGKVLAHGTTTCMVRSKQRSSPALRLT